MAHQIIVRFLSLPGIMRLGLLMLACGATLDLAFHAAPPGWSMDLQQYLGQHGEDAHLVTLLGMIMTVVGVPFRRAAQMAPVAETASNKES